MTFKILKYDLNTVLHRSVVRSAADARAIGINEYNLSQDVQDLLIKLDIKPSVVLGYSHCKDKSRAFNDSVSTRTRS